MNHVGARVLGGMMCALLVGACGGGGGGQDDNSNVNQDNNNNAAEARCGDGEVGGAEECDDGAANSDAAPDACRTDCRRARCGDGVVDSGETCDDGPANSDVVPGACRADCTSPACGDGVVDVGLGERCDCGDDPGALPEGCDGVNGAPGSLCRSDCLVSFCGNGVLDPEEACDDGNFQSGDGCNAACNSTEVCGNGILDLESPTGGEECDDGGTEDGDGCSASCHIEACGNGVVDEAAGEVCDDGNNVAGDGCSPDCRSNEICGNGIVDFGATEQCDDQNLRSHDGCSSGCTGEVPTFTLWQDPVPTVRRFGMAYDVSRDRVVVFGGEGSCGPMCDETLEFDGDRWQVIQTTDRPPARQLTTLAYDADRHRVVLFGGSGASNLRDVWEYDGASWTQVSTTNPPSGRAGGQIVYDPDRHVFYLFGGLIGSGGSYSFLNDLWQYDPAAAAWTELQGNTTSDPTTMPAPRVFFGMVYDQARQVLVIVGGMVEQGETAGHWEVDPGQAPLTWTRVSDPNPQPTWPIDRGGVAMAYDPDRHVVVLFGGGDCGGGSSQCGETWEYAVSAGVGAWTLVSIDPGSVPPGRTEAHLVYDAAGQRMILFAGQDENNALLDDTWAYGAGAWTDLSGLGAPSGRRGAVMVYDPTSRKYFLFGGSGVNEEVAPPDLWIHDGAGWRRKPCNNPGSDCPPGRINATMVWDSARQRAVLFGGNRSITEVLGDTWELDPATESWAQVSPGSSPPARTGAAMSYDAALGRVVLFGGGEVDSPDATGFGDTWEYDGTAWVETTPTLSPPARIMPAMTYDASNQASVLVGGIVQSGTPVMSQDTWIYRAGQWTDVTPSGGAPGAAMPGFVYHAGLHRAILFGGVSLSGSSDAVWAWDGHTWTQLYVNGPSARAAMASAWDPLGLRIAFFGGSSDRDLDELLFLRWDSPYPDEVCGNGLDDDRDGLPDATDPDCTGL